MSQDILINWSPQETRVAVVEQGAVQEVHLERTLERGLVGNIYLGKVSRVLPGMQSAFIDIGLDRAAFLHVADLMPNIAAKHATPRGPVVPPASEPDAAASAPANGGARLLTPNPVLPIERQIFEGQALMVQVLKDPIGTKGARLTAQISIAGRLLVFLPQDNHIGVSQKIPPAQREALRQRLVRLTATGDGSPAGGFILRTNAEDATDEELVDDTAYLRKTWLRIKEAATRQPPATLLHEDLNLMQRVLRDLVGADTQSIRIDSREQHGLLTGFAAEFMPDTVAKLQHYSGERPIFDLFNIDEDIVRALSRRVDLKSGGYLVIDQTEALTTVDVNTGGFVGARNFDDTVFRTNLEAAQAIARQLRLRNLGGIVIVDFIDMVRDDHREAVLTEFRKQLARDRVKTMTGGFSQLGLVEMTRKRTRESLAHMLSEPCEARAFNPREFRVVGSPKVVELFLDEERAHLAGLSDFIGKPISLQSESSMTQEQYDIVLL
jgi:ribonuclease G